MNIKAMKTVKLVKSGNEQLMIYIPKEIIDEMKLQDVENVRLTLTENNQLIVERKETHAK